MTAGGARRELVIVPDAGALARAGAARVRAAIEDAARATRRCTVALAGGRTPRGLYEVLAEQGADFPWEHVELWFGDERHVPPDHSDSNYRMVRDALLSRVAIPAANVHRMRTEQPDAQTVAADYARDLTTAFGVAAGSWPTFDVILLGMGVDGHTASLFPGTPALDVRDCLTVPVWVAELRSWRITLTYPVLNAARQVCVLVSGADKAETLRAVLEGGEDGAHFPVQDVHPQQGLLTWLVDEAAASRLTRRA